MAAPRTPKSALSLDEARFLFRVRVVCIVVILFSIVALVFASITQDIFHLRGSEALVGTLLGAMLLLMQVDGASLLRRFQGNGNGKTETEESKA